MRSWKQQLCSVVPTTKLAQAIRSIFSARIPLGPNWQESTKNMAVARWGVMQTVRKCFILLILSYKFRKERCYFFPCPFEHTIDHMIDCWVTICLLFAPEEPILSSNLSPAVRTCLHMLQFLEDFLPNPCQGRFNAPKSFVDSIPPPPFSCIPKIHWYLIE